MKDHAKKSHTCCVSFKNSPSLAEFAFFNAAFQEAVHAEPPVDNAQQVVPAPAALREVCLPWERVFLTWIANKCLIVQKYCGLFPRLETRGFVESRHMGFLVGKNGLVRGAKNFSHKCTFLAPEQLRKIFWSLATPLSWLFSVRSPTALGGGKNFWPTCTFLASQTTFVKNSENFPLGIKKSRFRASFEKKFCVPWPPSPGLAVFSLGPQPLTGRGGKGIFFAQMPFFSLPNIFFKKIFVPGPPWLSCFQPGPPTALGRGWNFFLAHMHFFGLLNNFGWRMFQVGMLHPPCPACILWLTLSLNLTHGPLPSKYQLGFKNIASFRMPSKLITQLMMQKCQLTFLMYVLLANRSPAILPFNWRTIFFYRNAILVRFALRSKFSISFGYSLNVYIPFKLYAILCPLTRFFRCLSGGNQTLLVLALFCWI